MNTIERLASYRSALVRYASKKRTHDLSIEAGKKVKALESEPSPSNFEIGASEMEWAEKIRREVLKPTESQNLDNKINKLPTRKV